MRSIRNLQAGYEETRTTAEFEKVIRGFANIEDKPFELFIVGEGNFGKSTLLNGLLGAQLSAVHFLPETRCFQRFLIADDPSDTCRIFARLHPQDHAWLKAKLGPGRESHELFATRIYDVPIDLADELIREEVKRCRDRSSVYEPAILEIERQIELTKGSLLTAGCRVVDTQGLNQLFPDELQQASKTMDGHTSVDRFDQWLSTTSRGKHLEWQLRRCDAILWVAHARKSSSGITLAALKWFSKYGKKIVLAVTNMDRVDGGAEGQAKVLELIEKTYGQYVACVVPLNAKLGMESALRNDPSGVEQSGLGHLAERIRVVCSQDAALTRSVGAYLALRATEAQLRQALHLFAAEIEKNAHRLQQNRREIASYGQGMGARATQTLERSSSQCLAKVRKNLSGLTLRDDGRSAKAKLNIENIGPMHRNAGVQICDEAYGKGQELQLRMESQPFSLPSFGAEGNVAGETVRTRVNLYLSQQPFPRFVPQITLSPDLWESFKIGLVGFFGVFFESARQKAAQMEREALTKIRNDVQSQVLAQWRQFTPGVDEHVQKEITLLTQQLNDGIDQVEESLESYEGEQLTNTSQRVRQCLRERAVPSVFMAEVLRVWKERAGTHKPL